MGEAGRAWNPGNCIVKPHAREDRHPVPLRLAVTRNLIASACQLLAEQLVEGFVGELGLL